MLKKTRAVPRSFSGPATHLELNYRYSDNDEHHVVAGPGLGLHLRQVVLRHDQRLQQWKQRLLKVCKYYNTGSTTRGVKLNQLSASSGRTTSSPTPTQRFPSRPRPATSHNQVGISYHDDVSPDFDHDFEAEISMKFVTEREGNGPMDKRATRAMKNKLVMLYF